MQDHHKESEGFWEELKRRRVVRAAIAYAGAAFVLLQALQLLFEASLISDSRFQWLVRVTLAGFPVALVLGWFFDVTPQGLRLTGQGGAAARLIVRARPGLIVGGASLVVLSGVAFISVAQFPQRVQAESSADANLMAVLPFTTTGEGVDVLREGMVDLLTRNLDEVGTIHMVDPRTALYRWQQRARGETLSLEDALAVAREVNASTLLTGSVVALEGSVRISAELYSLEGSQLASVRVDGSPDHLLALVDSLSVRLVREILRSEQPVPRLNVGAITSGNLDAIRAFLIGERHYRTSEWDSARLAFSRAVEEDSLFPLAHYRLASTAGWLGMTDLGRRSAAVARRHADRLPAREQALVRAEALSNSGQLPAAVDTLGRYVERYPDDPEGWFLLGDGLFHLRGETGGPVGALDPLWMFDKALELDPSYIPAMIHPLELAFSKRDRALMERYAQLLEQAAPDREGPTIVRAAIAALAVPADAAAMIEALERLAGVGPGSKSLARQAAQAVGEPLIRELATWPAEQRREVEARWAGDLGRDLRMRVSVLLATGRLEAARASLRDPVARRRMGQETAARVALIPALAGYTGPAWAEEVGLPPSPEQAAGLAMLSALDRDDEPGLAAALRGVQAQPREDAKLQEVLVRAGRGFQRVLRGDTVQGLADVRTALEGVRSRPGSVVEALWFRWVERMAMHPTTRPRVLEDLASPWAGEAVYEPLRLLVLARALRAEGRDAEAAEAYGTAARALAQADPGLGIRTRLAEARGPATGPKSGP